MEFMTEDFCKKHLYPVLLTLISSVGILSLVCAFFGLTTSTIWFSLLFPLLLIPMHFLSVNGKPLLFFLLFLPLSGLAFFLLLRFAGDVNTLVLAYTEWWNNDSAEQLPPYVLLLLLPAMLGISILYLLQRNYWSRLAASLLQTALLLTFRLLGYRTGKAAVVCFLGYLLFLLLETAFMISFRYRPSGKDTSGENNGLRKTPAYTAQLWPVVLSAMLMLSVIPYGKTPISWNFVFNIWNTVASAANDVFRFIRLDVLNLSSDFSLKFTGYDSSGALGGELFATTTDNLYVRTDSRVTNAIYLIGNTKNIYTGSSWENDITVPDQLLEYSDSYLDAAEFSYAVLRSGNYKYHDNHYLTNWYEIRFLDYHSSTLFAAAKTKRIDAFFPSDFSFKIDPDAIRFNRQMKKNTNYRTTFNLINLGSPELLSLAQAPAYPYDYSFKISPDYYLFSADYRELPTGKDLDYLFQLRRSHIRTEYLNLPSTVPYRVYELANSLTEDLSNDYEKMLALEEYLRTFRYTTSPGELPKNRELIDYFLFDSQEGYCTYFATALSVLGRCIGIPTRYVQGYCVYNPDFRGEWTIRSNNAHAWTEAYIDGIGWIPMDATPGYETLRYQPWHREEKKEPEITPVPDDRPNWWSSLYETGEPEPELPQEQKKDANLLLGLIILMSSVVLLLLFMALYILYRKIRLERTMQKASLEDRFYYEATQVFILTGLLCGRTKREHLFAESTLSEFTDSFVHNYSDMAKHAHRFCNMYAEVRYGTHTVTQEHCTFTLQYKSELLMLLAQEKGKRSVAVYRTGELLRY